MPKRTFKNESNLDPRKNIKQFIAWRKERFSKKKDLSYTVPQFSEKRIEFLNKNQTENTITWIGHSTFLIQLNGLNILTDPVWSKQMGFDTRLSEPGIKLEEMPEIDIVLISHNHYDHLSFSSIGKLKGKPLFILPEGLGELFSKKGYKNYLEFSWWENKEINGIEISSVPAQHWSKRGLFDSNTSHWCGFVLKFSNESIYFAGDSGYFNGFKKIGENFDINYALMPIGAYEPERFMNIQHTTPEEAIQAYLDLHANIFIPMHYGAFRIADDTPKEALDRFHNEWKRLNLCEEKRKVLLLGETLILKKES